MNKIKQWLIDSNNWFDKISYFKLIIICFLFGLFVSIIPYSKTAFVLIILLSVFWRIIGSWIILDLEKDKGI